MINFSEDLVNLINTTPISFATASADGQPNVVILSDIHVLSQNQIIIADNFMNKTRANLDQNKKVALTIASPEYKPAYQLKGTAEVFTDSEHRQQLIDLFGDDPRWSKKATVIVSIEEIWDLRAHQLVVKN